MVRQQGRGDDVPRGEVGAGGADGQVDLGVDRLGDRNRRVIERPRHRDHSPGIQFRARLDEHQPITGAGQATEVAEQRPGVGRAAEHDHATVSGQRPQDAVLGPRAQSHQNRLKGVVAVDQPRPADSARKVAKDRDDDTDDALVARVVLGPRPVEQLLALDAGAPAGRLQVTVRGVPGLAGVRESPGRDHSRCLHLAEPEQEVVPDRARQRLVEAADALDQAGGNDDGAKRRQVLLQQRIRVDLACRRPPVRPSRVRHRDVREARLGGRHCADQVGDEPGLPHETGIGERQVLAGCRPQGRIEQRSGTTVGRRHEANPRIERGHPGNDPSGVCVAPVIDDQHLEVWIALRQHCVEHRPQLGGQIPANRHADHGIRSVCCRPGRHSTVGQSRSGSRR